MVVYLDDFATDGSSRCVDADAGAAVAPAGGGLVGLGEGGRVDGMQLVPPVATVQFSISRDSNFLSMCC